MTSVDELQEESVSVIQYVNYRRTAQRLFNVITILAIAALFFIVWQGWNTDNNDTARISQDHQTLVSVCKVVNYSQLSPADRAACSGAQR